jgi:membrane associated rhomboid family serine protease
VMRRSTWIRTSTAPTPGNEASFAPLTRTIGSVDQTPTMPPPPTRERCYRHPNVETGVHCTRCGRPICPDCMIPAPVGHQCPECVAEARREYRQGPGRQVAVANVKATPVTKILLIAMAIGYLWELIVAGGPGSLLDGPSGQALIDAGALVPATGVTGADHLVGGIVGGEWWRLLSSMFLHAGLIHLALNSYVLWIFGNEIERQIGRLETLAVFLVTGVFAGATSFAFAPGFRVAVGASGAIFGLVGSFIAYNYLRRHHVMAQARLRSALGMLVLNLIIGFSIPLIDWRAHVGGVVAGLVAGFAVDPSRPAALRRLYAVVGLLVLLAAAVALVAVRTAQIKADPSILLRS